MDLLTSPVFSPGRGEKLTAKPVQGAEGGGVMSIANTQPHPYNGHIAKFTLPCSYILLENQGNM